MPIDPISAKTGIAKTSIYRRWPNKAALVIDAFLHRIGPGITFPKSASPVESIRLQMLALAKALVGHSTQDNIITSGGFVIHF